MRHLQITSSPFVLNHLKILCLRHPHMGLDPIASTGGYQSPDFYLRHVHKCEPLSVFQPLPHQRLRNLEKKIKSKLMKSVIILTPLWVTVASTMKMWSTRSSCSLREISSTSTSTMREVRKVQRQTWQKVEELARPQIQKAS